MTATLETPTAEEKRLLEVAERATTELKKDMDRRDNALIERLTKELEARFDAHQKQIADKFPQLSMPGVEIDTTGQNKKNAYSLARAACGVALRDMTLCPYEAEVSRELAKKRTMTFGADAGGGFFVPSEVLGGLIDLLNPQVISFDLGVRQVDAGNAAPISKNRKTGTTTAQWVGELASAAKSDIKLGRINAMPKALSAKTDISNLLMLLGQSVANDEVQRDFAEQFALAFDRAILIGASGDAGPIGIVNTIGVGTSPSASPTYDILVDFETVLMQANALFGQVGWAMSVAQYALIRKIKDASGQPLIWRDLQGGGLQSILGYKFRTSTQLGTTGANTLILGNFAQTVFYRWFGGMILKSTDTSDDAIDNNVTRVAAFMYGDVAVEQPSAFVKAST